MNIPFYKPCLGDEEIQEVIATLKSGWLTTGPRTKQFESEFAQYLGQRHAVAVNSCTAALHLALEAVGLQPGDGVLVPTMTFAATAGVVGYLGGVPILVDCREHDFNLDAADAERRIQAARQRGQRIAAILPVHYGGQVGDVSGVAALAQRHQLKIIEDAAHCCPAYYRTNRLPPGLGRGNEESRGVQKQAAAGDLLASLGPSNDWQPVGRSADIACFSFYANKCITTGEGGMACTANEDWAERMRIMSLHGISREAWKRYSREGTWDYEIIAPGYKYNLGDLAAALGIHQLRKAHDLHQRRCLLAGLYREKLKDLDELILPRVQPDRIHSWHLFVIRLRLECLTINRSEFIERLKEAGIAMSVHYKPLHMHPYYRDQFGYRAEDLPVMASVYPEIVSLPLYPDLAEAEVDYVCATIQDLVHRHRPKPVPVLRTLSSACARRS